MPRGRQGDDDDRDVRIRARVTELRALFEAVPADVDRVGLGVVMQPHRDDLGLSLRTDGGEPCEPLPSKVRDLGRREDAHAVTSVGE